MAFERPRPPAVYQSNTWWCWAACLEVISTAHPNKFPSPPNPRTQSQWIDALRSSPAAGRLMNSQGGLNVHYLPAILNMLGMQGHDWSGTGTDVPDISFIEQQLRVSYLWSVHIVPGGSHFVVIYGVSPTHVYYFNPFPGTGYSKITHAQARSNRLIIAWKP